MYVVERNGDGDSHLNVAPIRQWRLDGQSGVVVGVAGGIACLDYVSRSDVFAGLYLKLLLISDPLSTCDARPQVLARPRRMGRMRR
jgi:hypothetical protein